MITRAKKTRSPILEAVHEIARDLHAAEELASVTSGADESRRRTTLNRMEPHRLRALILEDLERYPDSGRVDIHRRIGPEIHPKTLMRTLDALAAAGAVVGTGVRRWRKYRLAESHGHES